MNHHVKQSIFTNPPGELGRSSVIINGRNISNTASADCVIIKATPFNSSTRNLAARMVKRSITESPLEVARAVKQYLYDEHGKEYLDCVNGTTHVGHSHPNVTTAGQRQMEKLQTCQGFRTELKPRYVQRLVESLPETLSVCYLCNSTSEANDLAVRMAWEYTGNEDVLVVEGGQHGTTGTLIDISTKIHNAIPNYKPKDWVHVTSLPDRFRGIGVYKDVESKEVDAILDRLRENGKGVACFFCEPLFVTQGVHVAPNNYFKNVYASVRANGGVTIADESATGLGRLGSHMWSFSQYDVTPDIVTIGKSLGNGFPLAAVICTKEISDKLGGYFTTYGGNPVACAIGISVLDTIAKEQLQCSAKMVGRNMKQSLIELKDKFDILGDVRGEGLLFSLEIVDNKKCRTPLPVIGRDLMMRLKTSGILVEMAGRDDNVVLFSPPLCFTMDNGRRFVKAVDQCLEQITGRLREERELAEELREKAEDGGEPEAKKVKSVEVGEFEETEVNEDNYEDMD